MSKSASIWANAKTNNDYSLFKDTLAEIINFSKKMVKIKQWCQY
jgi:Zn-dependent M32 family carboxypeptidase